MRISLGLSTLYALSAMALPGCGGGGDDPVLVPGGLQPDAPWPMFRADARHTGRSAQTGPTAPEIEWSFDVDGPGSRFNQISIDAGGNLYFGTENYDFRAVDATGAEIWTLVNLGPSHSPAIFDDGTIFHAAGALFALEPEDGAELWSYWPDDGVEVSAAVAIGDDGMILAPSEGQGLIAFSANGDVMWRYDCGAAVRTAPAIGADGTIYVGCNDGTLHAIDPAGDARWIAPLEEPDQACPVIGDDGRILVATYAGSLSAFEPSGALAWSVEIAGLEASRQPALGLDGEIYVQTYDAVRAFDRDGGDLWSFPVAGDGTPLVDAAGTIYAADGARLFAIDPDGAEIWSLEVAGETPVMGADGTIYVLGDGLFAVGEAE